MIYIKLRYWVRGHSSEVWIPSSAIVSEIMCCVKQNWDYEVLEVSTDDPSRNNYGF